MQNPAHEALRLENQICFPLYAASREVIRRYRPYLDALGLTYTQYIVLLVIWEHGTISVRDLGRILCLDSGTLTPVLKTLEKAGLIDRRRSVQDERVLMITLTQAGSALQEKALEIPSAIRSSLPLDDEEMQTLAKLLDKIYRHTGEE